MTKKNEEKKKALGLTVEAWFGNRSPIEVYKNGKLWKPKKFVHLAIVDKRYNRKLK